MRTVERLGLQSRATVLDAPCGAGGSAIAAAQAVGPEGTVVALDWSEGSIELARRRADERRLNNIQFQTADMRILSFGAGSFDAIVCAVGIFLAADMEAQLASFWRMLARGGVLAVTTWGPRLFAPMYRLWRDEVRRIRPDLETGDAPWDRIATRESAGRMFRAAGLPAPDIEIQYAQQYLDHPRDFWTIALGSGLRASIDQLGPGAACVRRAFLRRAADLRVRSIETNVIYAVARKP